MSYLPKSKTQTRRWIGFIIFAILSGIFGELGHAGLTIAFAVISFVLIITVAVSAIDEADHRH